jgi:Zn ribbon nucleic-acid-binding protein
MTRHLDLKYINMLSSKLERFTWRKRNLATCRCPVCGDSQKKKSKTRFYFYESKESFYVKCHNCGYAASFYNFLKSTDALLFRDYSSERYLEKMSVTRNEEETEMIGLFKKVFKKFEPKDEFLKELPKISELPENHVARQFLELRRIPKQHYDILYYSEDFGSWMRSVDPETGGIGKEKRLVIPFFNKHGQMVAAQGRVLNMKGEMNARNTARYITIKADKSIDRLWYGLWRCDPKKKVYVVEGPLDSLFIPNTVAMVGAAALNEIHPHIEKSDLVFVLDNEPRNEQIVKYNQKLIEDGRKICIWPDHITFKDINDMIYTMSVEEIRRLIDENTFSGLEAKLRLQRWSKI